MTKEKKNKIKENKRTKEEKKNTYIYIYMNEWINNPVDSDLYPDVYLSMNMCGQGKTRFALEPEEEAGFIHYKVSTENKKIGQVRMLTRRRGSTPDIKWRGWGRSGIYPLKNFHGKNWTSRSAVSLSPPPPRPHHPTNPYVSTRSQTSMLTQGPGFQVAGMIEWGQ